MGPCNDVEVRLVRDTNEALADLNNNVLRARRHESDQVFLLDEASFFPQIVLFYVDGEI